jgi:DNA polymerase-4
MERWPRIVIHADMDAFYASVEQLDNPELRGKPILVGPKSNRGVVLTASYEARPYGVGSAMGVAEARRRCPKAIMVEPNFARYKEISEQVMDIFADFSPSVEAISLDEAFLEMTGAEHFFGPPASMGQRIKEAVFDATNLHISVGVSGTKYVAKVASAHDKPNGLTIVPQEEAVAWLAPMPINRIWGVGKKTAPKLLRLGYKTVGDIANADERVLYQQLGSAGPHFYRLAHARDPRPVLRGRAAKSIGSDRTLGQDISRPEEILVHLRRSAERISRRVRAKNCMAGGVRIRLKTTKFELLTRQRHLSKPADTADAFLSLGMQLLAEFDHKGPFRLVGMTAFDLHWQDELQQLDLFEPPDDRKLETTVDHLIERFGKDVVIRARDMQNPGTIAKSGVDLDFLDSGKDKET